MNRWLPALALVPVLTLLPGCAAQKRRAAERQRAALESRERGVKKEAQLVGTIALVNLEDGFTLIDCGMHPSPLTGTVLKSQTGAAESAELRVSEVRRRPFVIADIVSGIPLKGDLAVQPVTLAPVTSVPSNPARESPTAPAGSPLPRSPSRPY